MERTVVIPAHNEENTVADVVSTARIYADEVIVVASACSDRTSERAVAAGAKIVVEAVPGKHYALRAGLAAASGRHVAFMDADLVDLPPDLANRLFAGLEGEALLSKGYYHREIDGEARLTEICARPLLSLKYPALAKIRDPLSGEFAVVRSAARKWKFAPGFSVDLGFLMSASESGIIREVDLGRKRHKHRSVHALGQAAVQVAATILGCSNGHDWIDYSQSVNGICNEHRIDVQWLPALD